MQHTKENVKELSKIGANAVKTFQQVSSYNIHNTTTSSSNKDRVISNNIIYIFFYYLNFILNKSTKVLKKKQYIQKF